MCKCTTCNCDETMHDEYMKCPLLNNQIVCDVCCMHDIESSGTHLNIFKLTNISYSVHEIDEICYLCGKSGRIDFNWINSDNFVNQFISGKVSLNDIDHFIEKWHNSKFNLSEDELIEYFGGKNISEVISRSNVTIFEYLGLSESDYSEFVLDNKSLVNNIKKYITNF